MIEIAPWEEWRIVDGERGKWFLGWDILAYDTGGNKIRYIATVEEEDDAKSICEAHNDAQR